MKKILTSIAFGLFLVVASCEDSDQPSKESGDEQVPVPVPNSGAETESERATNAVKDSNRDTRPRPDTPRTSVTVGPDGGSVSTKTGTGVSVDRKGVKLKNRKVNIDIKRDTN